MKAYLICILICLTQLSLAQNWININRPQTGVLGKLIINSGLSGDRIETSFIQTEDGASEYKEVASSHFNFGLKVTTFDNLKFMNATVDTMSIDYLSDKALYTNDNYFTNPFVYKAIRAKSVNLTFKKTLA